MATATDAAPRTAAPQNHLIGPMPKLAFGTHHSQGADFRSCPDLGPLYGG